MGHRGCRLCVTYPEIAVMQTRAVIKAAINVKKKHPEWNIVPEIMIPLVGEVKELQYVKKLVVETADALIKESGVNLQYKVGTMIEIPRACVTADEIAKEADFFSFGTNDLTQMTFGFSRDDAGKFRRITIPRRFSSPIRLPASIRTASASLSEWPSTWPRR
jgi:pyruvate,orthophosphate dikinase